MSTGAEPALVAGGGKESAARLRDRAVLATRVSFAITDPNQPDNPLVWVNPAFTETTGYAFDEAIGRNCRFLQGPRTDRGAVREIARSLDEGRPITTTLLNYRKDGTTFWNELSISPVLDRAGGVTHFVGVQADVTGRIDAQQARDEAFAQAELFAGRLRLLADFGARLTSSLEGDDIVDLLTKVVIPQLATWCAVHVLDETGSLRSIVRHARGEAPVTAAVVQRLEQVLLEPVPANVPTARIMSGEVPFLLVADTAGNPDESGLFDDERTRLARALGIASLLAVPLRSRNQVLGVLTLVADESRRPFAPEDVSLVQELGMRAGVMLENSVLYTRERTAAVALQRSLLPRIPALTGLTVAAEYLTATDHAAVGGDWYDVFALRDGAVGIAVGDAMGHNFESAAAMGKLSTMLRAYAWPGSSPADVLDAVDALLAGTDLRYLATCLYGELRLTDTGASFEYATAGHPPPIVRSVDGTARLLDRGHGAMLGVSSLLVHGRARSGELLNIERGGTLLFFTDGLTDSMGDDLDIWAACVRLAEVVAEQPVGAAPIALVEALVAQSQSDRKDDIAVVAVRVD